MRFASRWVVAAVGCVAGAGSAGAQQMLCPPGKVVVPYFGWDATECGNCRIYGYYMEYLNEPKIRDIRAPGPAEGKLRDDDAIVAVNGQAITTEDAWHTLRDATPGSPLDFTVRRDGQLVSARVTPAATCGTPRNDRRAPGGLIVIVRPI